MQWLKICVKWGQTRPGFITLIRKSPRGHQMTQTIRVTIWQVMEEKRAVKEIKQPSQGSGQIEIGTRSTVESHHPHVQPCVSVCTLLTTAALHTCKIYQACVCEHRSLHIQPACRCCHVSGVRHKSEMTWKHFLWFRITRRGSVSSLLFHRHYRVTYFHWEDTKRQQVGFIMDGTGRKKNVCMCGLLQWIGLFEIFQGILCRICLFCCSSHWQGDFRSSQHSSPFFSTLTFPLELFMSLIWYILDSFQSLMYCLHVLGCGCCFFFTSSDSLVMMKLMSRAVHMYAKFVDVFFFLSTRLNWIGVTSHILSQIDFK